jgi:type VI secretion system protein ImpA
MPLRTDLLNPIAGPNPAGENLRYAPVYDQIREARRQEEAVTEGDWQTPGKKANWPLVIKLAGDALATRSKDLQLAAWLTEALIRTEGFAPLAPCLDLIRELLENFWDGLYPEIEDGDLELRATPLEWIGSQLETPIKQVPLTRSGLDWFQYKISRSVPTEDEAANSDARRAQRETAIAEGKLTPEEFDSAFHATPTAFYQQAFEHLEAARDSLAQLTAVCDEKFGDFSPSFSVLRNTLEEVQQSVRILLQRKQALEGPPAEEEVAEQEAVTEEVIWTAEEATALPVRAEPAPRRKAPAAEPQDREDAVERVVTATRFLRRDDPYSPVPYLLLRALRWGELRAAGPSPDYSVLEAPSTEIRQQLKRLTSEGSWAEALEVAEEAAGAPCGRAWLDVQRYALRCLTELGYEAAANALRAELRALLADYPELPNWSLSDDTPVANAETQAWLKEEILTGQGQPGAPEEPLHSYGAPHWEQTSPAAEGEEQPPDAYTLALDALRSGRPKDAIEILAREAAQERSGRARFQRRIQLAEVCMAAGYEAVAWPILEELAQEIEQRKLEEWEAPEALAHPLTLLFRCLSKLDRQSEEKQKIYARICRLDPIQALACGR